MSSIGFLGKSVLFRFLGNQNIAKTLLLWIVFVSSLVTITLSGIQLYIDYKLEVGTINNRLDEIESSYKDIIEGSLWNVDLAQLNVQLEGIVRLPDIQAVTVEENQAVDGSIFISKGVSNGSGVLREYDLTHFDGKERFVIGSLLV